MKNILSLFFASAILLSCQNTPKNTANTNKVESTNSVVQKKAKPEVSNKDAAATTNTQLQGIDISNFQNNIEWNKVVDDQISFVMVKATGGETYEDSSFVKHWTDVKEAGIMRGAYHFYYTKDSPTAQANFFISKVLSTYDANDLPPIIDIETEGINTKISVAQLQQDIKIFLGVVEKAFNRKPILYTSYSFAQKYFDNPDFDQYYLWLADYYNDNPPIPNGWTKSGWTFWQNSSSAVVNGIEGKVDHDIFKGTLVDLKSL